MIGLWSELKSRFDYIHLFSSDILLVTAKAKKTRILRTSLGRYVGSTVDK